MPKSLFLYSDGGGERGSTAAGACIVEDTSGKRLNLICFLGPATNNEAEITAGLLGFSFLRAISQKEAIGSPVCWVSDSEYVLKSATSYINLWQRNGWKTAAKQAVKNQGLWRAFLNLSDGLKIEAKPVRGHSGHPENEACDSASTWAREHGAKFLKSHGQGTKVSAGGAASGRPWLLFDARPFLSCLREKTADAVTEEESFFLVRELRKVGFSGLSSTSNQADTRAEDLLAKSSSEGSLLVEVLSRLKEVRQLALSDGNGEPRTKQIASEIDTLIASYSEPE